MWSAERWEQRRLRASRAKAQQQLRKRINAKRERRGGQTHPRRHNAENQRFRERLRFDQHHIWDWNWAEDERRDLHSIPSWWSRFAHYCQLYGAWGFTARSRNGREVWMGTQIKEKT